YTDERGTQTTFFIPVPRGHLAITSPHAVAKVPILWQDQPPPYYETPTATPAVPIVYDPFTIASTIPESPTKQQTLTSIDAMVYGCFSPTPPPSCNEEREGMVAEARDTALTQAGNLLVCGVPVHQSNGYDNLLPGPGRVDLFLNMSWLIAPQGFRSIG